MNLPNLPTLLFHPEAQPLLLTEALRGEEAVLRRPDGSHFMPNFDLRAELASRDVVARATAHRDETVAYRCVLPRYPHQLVQLVKHRFPALYHQLNRRDLDSTQQLIPIIPAAHYTCRGPVVDQHSCRAIAGLYAIGKVSYPGLHGTNRLGLNSLLECLVYGWSTARHISQQLPHSTWGSSLPPWHGEGKNSRLMHPVFCNDCDRVENPACTPSY